MIIHPLCQWAHPMPSEDVGSGICQCPIYSPGRREAKIVADVDRKLVICLQPDDEPGPLVGLDRNRPVCLCDIADGGLGAWGEAGNE